MSKKPKIDPAIVQAALDLKFAKKDADSGAKSVREYLRELLSELWHEEECFSGKRPFGNSGWQWDVYRELVAANLVNGQLDRDGNLEDFDEEAGALLMQAVIAKAFEAA
ncbi:MAG TPA: hypothetical protein VIN03_11845 [Roseateles sp.]